MGDTEQKATVVGVLSESAPPVYHQQDSAPKSSGAVSPPKYAVATPIPLPTYDQSEKYEKDGVLQVSKSSSESETEDTLRPRVGWYRISNNGSGSCFEFIIFFIFCAVLNVVGFVLSFCLATSTAAQSGAIAGLGTAFIAKPLLYEFYSKNHEQQWAKNWCAGHGDGVGLDKCVHWYTTSMQTVFFIIGFFGLILLYKGFAAFFRSRGSSTN